MLNTLLVANRGEIACRIIRSARALGLRTVAVYSDADRQAPHVALADLACHIGPAAAADSYLNVERLLEAAVRTGADAVHPGYGFLSENADFAAACQAAGLHFVGPRPEAIRLMGSKIESKRRVAAAGTPVVPGYQGDDQADAVLTEAAAEVGYPLLIKASAGGGGKGMRLVERPEAFAEALAAARREAAGAFGDDRVLLERYLHEPKHLEVQILADRYGHTLHLFERDCSVQRRHQKVIEEAPGPAVTPALRERLGAAAVQVARAIGYEGAGTVEFIAEGEDFYFMEMNTRLQVEHPVTEAITGEDLVAWQLRIAAGERLTLEQSDLRIQGHAIEARLYAENPARGFLPASGVLQRVQFPEGIRVDTGVVSGSAVTIDYDPMLAKLIAWGEDRETARRRLRAALAQTVLLGPATNQAYLDAVLALPAFINGEYHTGTVEAAHEQLLAADPPPLAVFAALALWQRPAPMEPWSRTDGFRMNLSADRRLLLLSDGMELSLAAGPDWVRAGETRYRLGHVDLRDERLTCELDGRMHDATVVCSGERLYCAAVGHSGSFTLPALAAGGGASGAPGDRVLAPMPGQIIAVKVALGDPVTAGQILVIMEAMKMEQSLRAPCDGTVAALSCSVGGRVEDGMELVRIEADETQGESV